MDGMHDCIMHFIESVTHNINNLHDYFILLQHKDLFKKLQKNSSKKIDQSYAFHSILDCAGIKSEAINLTKKKRREKFALIRGFV